MKWRWHLLTTFIIMGVIAIFTKTVNIVEGVIIPPIWATLFSDCDAKFQYVRKDKKDKLQETFKKFSIPHRSIWTHSIILTFIVWLYDPSLLLTLMIFAQGVHCLEDINVMKSTRLGTYNIHYLKIFNKTYGMKGRASTLWLLLQFAGGSAILGGWLVYV